VPDADATLVQGDLEGDPPVAAGSAGEHGAVEFLRDVKGC
jgi:hypothetical protein